MSDKEKIEAAVQMLRTLKRMVGFFMRREISELIEILESDCPKQNENSSLLAEHTKKL